VLKAPAAKLYAVVTDYARYPEWLPEFKDARILRAEGNEVDVEFTFAIPLKKIRYSIRVAHKPAELQTDWTFLRGEVIDNSVGGWKFEAIDNETTRVRYYAGVSVNVPVSRSVVNRIASLLTGTTLPRTFKNLEQEALKRG
jgi:ribosome-associated toxin RatA of RatAB toxin-antitoxin module